LIAIDKPAGLLVHPLLDVKTEKRNADVIRVLRKQIGQKVYPVHRLDRATSGVLLLALNPEVARKLQLQFQEKLIQKIYYTIIRGWVNDNLVIDSPLTKRLDGGALLPSQTEVETVVRFELPVPSQLFPTSRFSLLKVSPHTGRLHQIRRHLKRIHHPIIGDTVHGDGKQNRIWRELTGDQRLYLKAQELHFSHPMTGEGIHLVSKWSPVWKRAFQQIEKANGTFQLP